MRPSSIARFTDASAYPAPSVPRSRSAVNPASNVSRLCNVAAIVRYANASFSTWSFHTVSLYGCRNTCECASMSPGNKVIPGNSIVTAPFGTVTLDAGPTAAIVSPETRTTQPSCVALLVASKTRWGWRRVGGASANANVARRTMSAKDVRRERISAFCRRVGGGSRVRTFLKQNQARTCAIQARISSSSALH